MLSEDGRIKKPKSFLILGSGGSGTSLLRGLLNAHSKIRCEFENMDRNTWEQNQIECNASDMIYGNKIPLQKAWNCCYTNEEILAFSEEHIIIWITRRPGRWPNGENPRWKEMLYLGWQMKDAHPLRVLMVQFEDLLVSTKLELQRICGFLDISFESRMLNGTRDTGYLKYNQKEINLKKIGEVENFQPLRNRSQSVINKNTILITGLAHKVEKVEREVKKRQNRIGVVNIPVYTFPPKRINKARKRQTPILVRILGFFDRCKALKGGT